MSEICWRQVQLSKLNKIFEQPTLDTIPTFNYNNGEWRFNQNIQINYIDEDNSFISTWENENQEPITLESALEAMGRIQAVSTRVVRPSDIIDSGFYYSPETPLTIPFIITNVEV